MRETDEDKFVEEAHGDRVEEVWRRRKNARASVMAESDNKTYESEDPAKN